MTIPGCPHRAGAVVAFQGRIVFADQLIVGAKTTRCKDHEFGSQDVSSVICGDFDAGNGIIGRDQIRGFVACAPTSIGTL